MLPGTPPLPPEQHRRGLSCLHLGPQGATRGCLWLACVIFCHPGRCRTPCGRDVPAHARDLPQSFVRGGGRREVRCLAWRRRKRRRVVAQPLPPKQTASLPGRWSSSLTSQGCRHREQAAAEIGQLPQWHADSPTLSLERVSGCHGAPAALSIRPAQLGPSSEGESHPKWP